MLVPVVEFGGTPHIIAILNGGGAPSIAATTMQQLAVMATRNFGEAVVVADHHRISYPHIKLPAAKPLGPPQAQRPRCNTAP